VGISRRAKRVRIRRLGAGIDYDELEQLLAETARHVPKDVECRPKTRLAVDPLRLTKTQCSVFPAGKEIGRGSFATAFEHAHDPSKVVKFTSDSNDARSAAAIKGKRLKGAAQVYDVAVLPNVGALLDVYGIVVEKLEPIASRDASSVIDSFDDFIGDVAEDRRMRGQRVVPGKKFDLGPDFKARSVKRCEENVSRGEAKALCPVLTPKLVDAVEEVGTVGGIFTTDLHAGNWGLRPDGSPVILDFGLSRVADDAEQPVTPLAGRPRRRKVRR
jgi:hypothetical protein